MRLAITFAALLIAAPAIAQEMPARKAGLWEMTMTFEGRGAPPQTMQQCIDAATDKAMQDMSQGARGQTCSKRETKKVGELLLNLGGTTLPKVTGATSDHGSAVGESTKALAKHEQAVQDLVDAFSGADAIEKATLAIEAYHKGLGKGIDLGTMTAEQQVKIAETMEAAMLVYQASGRAIPAEMKAIADAARGLSHTVSETTKNDLEALKDVLDSVKAIAADIDKLSPSSGPRTGDGPIVARDLRNIGPLLAHNTQGNLAGVDMGPSLITSLFGSPQQIGQQMASAIVGAFQGGGSAVASAAGALGSSVATNFVKSMEKSGSKLFTGALGSIFAGALPVVGSLLGPLVGKIGEFFSGLFNRDKGRDLVKEWAQSITGSSDLNALHRWLQEKLPESAERFWVMLTQGAAHGSPDAAKAAIAMVIAELEKQKTKQDEVAASAAESAKAQQEALDAITEKHKARLDELASEYKTLSDSVAREAEEEVMGITEMRERERMKQIEDEKKAIETQRDAEIAAKRETFAETLAAGQEMNDTLREMFERGYKSPVRFTFPDGMPPGFISPSALSAGYDSGLTGGWEGSTPAGALAGGGGTAQFFMDGRMVAEVAVPHIPGVVNRLGLS